MELKRTLDGYMNNLLSSESESVGKTGGSSKALMLNGDNFSTARTTDAYDTLLAAAEACLSGSPIYLYANGTAYACSYLPIWGSDTSGTTYSVHLSFYCPGGSGQPTYQQYHITRTLSDDELDELEALYDKYPDSPFYDN